MPCFTTLCTEIIFKKNCWICGKFLRKVSYSVSPFEILYFGEIAMNLLLNVWTQAKGFYNFDNPLYRDELRRNDFFCTPEFVQCRLEQNIEHVGTFHTNFRSDIPLGKLSMDPEANP